MPKTRQQDHVVVLPNNPFTITYTKKWSYYSGLGLFLRCNRYPPHYFFRMLSSQQSETPPTPLCCRRLPQVTVITLSPDEPRQLMLKQNISLFSKNRLQITFRWMIKHFFKLKVQYVGVVPGKMYLKCSKQPTAWQKGISWREQMCQAYTKAILCTYRVIIKEKWKPAPQYNPSQAVCLHLPGCSPWPLPNTHLPCSYQADTAVAARGPEGYSTFTLRTHAVVLPSQSTHWLFFFVCFLN